MCVKSVPRTKGFRFSIESPPSSPRCLLPGTIPCSLPPPPLYVPLLSGPATSWSNLCVSRWRLGPEQRHAEVWRAPDRGKEGGTVATRTVVSPPVPPPSWRSIYSRLHRKMRVPTGALSPSHTVVGRSTQEVRVRALTGRRVRPLRP